MPRPSQLPLDFTRLQPPARHPANDVVYELLVAIATDRQAEAEARERGEAEQRARERPWGLRAAANWCRAVDRSWGRR